MEPNNIKILIIFLVIAVVSYISINYGKNNKYSPIQQNIVKANLKISLYF